jgi:hypothetical protein
VENKRVNVCAQFCDDEGHFVSHQAADEMNVPTEAI